jgi:hypothetical protein
MGVAAWQALLFQASVYGFISASRCGTSLTCSTDSTEIRAARCTDARAVVSMDTASPVDPFIWCAWCAVRCRYLVRSLPEVLVQQGFLATAAAAAALSEVSSVLFK